MKNRVTSFVIILLIIIGMVLTIIIKGSDDHLILWTIILVTITSLYVHATFKILDVQNKAEILKYFTQIHIKKVSAIEKEHQIKNITFEFLNVSDRIGFNAKLKIFQGDSIVELYENGNKIIQKDIGILQPNSPSFHNIILKDPLILDDNCIKLRIELKYLNPLKIENIFYYLVTFFHQTSGTLGIKYDLLDFDNGIKNANLKEVRNRTLNNCK